MTIYTPSQADKKPAQDAQEPEVVTDTEPLTGEKKEKEAFEAVIVNNQYNDGRAILLRARRRSAFMHMLLALIILGVLALGAIGSVVLYRHLNKKVGSQVYAGRCGNEFFDVTYHETSMRLDDEVQKDYVDEDIAVYPEANYEELHTPRFDEVQETFVLHDFVVNYTALIDHKQRRCFITTIRNNILRPDDFVIQVQQRTPFGSILQTVVIRENYVMVIPDHFNPPFGKRIYEACFRYETYRLELYVNGVMKRSALGMTEKHGLGEQVGVYAVFTNNATHQQLYKIQVYEPMQLP
ncbi:integral membrane protein 2B-like [Elysia marginata]|uniref:Integral membrane protein 2 n=1 Tax=Elysia marginata TaxID=1093978 RepID=A0AAV4FJN5_9GAST|nr:integral membrane protein 2B-like [Elysia marginata]